MSQSPRPEGPLLEVDRLAVTFYTPRGTVRAVRDASLEIRRGEVLGLVGESGCGKSTVAFALMGYLPGTAQVDGTIRFAGKDIAHLTPSELRELRGNRMAMVYQDPATSLNPAMRVGPQIDEVLREHLALNARSAKERTAELFDSVGLADPTAIGRRYPHELSGGMQQRVMIAMALACDPDLLIMDEPTTGLDVTTEATILDLVVDLKDRVNAGILFVSHNLGVIARVSDRVIVMYAGQTVEQAPVREIFKNPSHPYTAGLLSCMPQPPGEGEATTRLRRIAGAVYAAEERAADTCLFAPRCPMAQDNCRSAAPDMADAGANHLSRCFYRDDVRPEIWGEPEPRDEGRSDEAEQVLEVQDLQQLYGNERRKSILFGPPVRP
ncbi:MAG: ABC transporter ATP-binding protein, partial [Chloroflexi bacterium]|nr:ABC transporter ATP-binding protein [Chloroflexota bacterium]